MHFDSTRLFLRGPFTMSSISSSSAALLDSAPVSLARVVLGIDGMASPKMEHTIEASLDQLPGVKAQADFATRSLHLEFDRSQCQLAEIVRRLDDLGLTMRSGGAMRQAVVVAPLWVRMLRAIVTHHQLLVATLGTLFLLAAVVVRHYETGVNATPLRLLLVGASFVLAGWFTAIDTFKVLARFEFDIDVLMFAAAFGAAAIGHYEEGAFLLVLFAFSGAGEELAMDKAHKAIEALSKLAPDTAKVRGEDGVDRIVQVESLKMGDRVIVHPFDRLPIDGKVESGESSIDQSPITGESVPVEKVQGDTVFAGTINGEGLLMVTVTRPMTESTLARIIKMVHDAQATKSPTEMFTAKVERWYVPFVLLATLGVMLVPPAMGWHHRQPAAAADEFQFIPWLFGILHFHPPRMDLGVGWFYQAMAFLTGASPCALAIGTPAAVLSGIAKAARIGVLVKGGGHLENLGKINVIAFDKTGTLTRGRPDVTDVVSLGLVSEDELLSLAASIEVGSTHPLANAIVGAARSRQIKWPLAEQVQQIAGQGVTGVVNGRRVGAGKAELQNGDGTPLTTHAQRLIENGKSVVLISIDDKPAGLIGLADQLRDNARASLERLKKLGIQRTIMLTGDRNVVAAEVARQVGIDEYHAELLPEDKLRIVDELQKKYGPLAMIGDGVNDAPALATATVGIAMGGAGTDVALETADVALMADDLAKLPDAIALSRFSRRIITQNLVIALGVISVLAPLSALGYTYLGVAVMFHEGSTLVVVLNALRLLMWKGAIPVSAGRP